MEDNSNLIEIRGLKKYFPVQKGLLRKQIGSVKAVDDIHLNIRRGEIIGLVGESGCGKSTFGRCVLQIIKPTDGSVVFNGTELSELSKQEMRRMRRRLQMICQDPFSSLDPRQKAGSLIGEGLTIHNLASGSKYRSRVEELLDMVGLDTSMKDRYPHEFSGGQRQRIAIARALAVKPDFIICDEPVSALDVSIQAQIIKLLKDLQKELNLTYLFIGHDLSVVRNFSDRVAVMYLGKIVEITSSEQLYKNPLHSYTQALLSAVPIPNPAIDKGRERILLYGDIPSPINPPEGCRFSSRCRFAVDECRRVCPELENAGNDHFVACHLT